MPIADARAEQELRELAGTQAALRRLATLVARGEPPAAVFAAATREALRHFGGGTARMIRFESDGTATLVASEGTTGPHVRAGESWQGHPPAGLTATVRRTGRAARVDDYRDVPGGEPYLREGLRSGIHPAILSSAGLRPALRALGRRSAVPVDIDVRIDGRLPEPVEVAAYYVVSEMLTNAAKHACASVVEAAAEASGGTLRVRVRDDGAGGADPRRGSGLTGLKDRVEALGGTFSVHSPAGGGTTVCCELPVMAGGGQPDAGPGEEPMRPGGSHCAGAAPAHGGGGGRTDAGGPNASPPPGVTKVSSSPDSRNPARRCQPGHPR